MIIPDMPPFIRFSTSHLAAMFLSVFLFIYIPYRIYKNPKASWVDMISKSLGILLIGNELGWVVYKLSLGHTYWAEFMPFELCTINAYLLGILLIFRPSYAIFEVVYFWAMAGTVQGIITPRLFAGYPHYLFFEYFITHTGIVLATLILVFRYHWKVTWSTDGGILTITIDEANEFNFAVDGDWMWIQMGDGCYALHPEGISDEEYDDRVSEQTPPSFC